jgi:dienelactone hydrolase
VASPVEIPLYTDDGELCLAGALFCRRPRGPAPAAGRPVVVVSHGAPVTAAERRAMTPFDSLAAVTWFVDRGYLVLTVMRHGFGRSEGRFGEGVDRERLDYAAAGHVAARDLRAAIDFLTTLPGVDLERVVIAGHAAGGFGALALLSDAGLRPRAVLSFAGGTGVEWLRWGRRYADGIVAAASEYGRAARTPALWIYADNDRWIAPPLVARMLGAYAAGGAPVEMVRLPPVGLDGHELFTAAAVRLWTSAAERFLERLGLPARPLADPPAPALALPSAL